MRCEGIGDDHFGALLGDHDRNFAWGGSMAMVALAAGRPLPPDKPVVGDAVFLASVSDANDPVKVSVGERLEGGEAGASYRFRVGLVVFSDEARVVAPVGTRQYRPPPRKTGRWG